MPISEYEELTDEITWLKAYIHKHEANGDIKVKYLTPIIAFNYTDPFLRGSMCMGEEDLLALKVASLSSPVTDEELNNIQNEEFRDAVGSLSGFKANIATELQQLEDRYETRLTNSLNKIDESSFFTRLLFLIGFKLPRD